LKKNTDMDEILIKVKSKSELSFVTDFLKRMKIESKVLTLNEKEDIALGKEMKLSRKSGKGDKTKVLEYLNKNS